MSKFFSAIKNLRIPAVLAVTVLASHQAFAQAPAPSAAPTPMETAPVETAAPAPATNPIVHNWHLNKLDGHLNLVVNPDGTYVFSGGFKDKKPGYDWDITGALKSSLGAVILFHYEGDASHGIEFSKQGKSAILADDFATFTGKHQASWSYRFHLSAEGRRARFEAMERKREQLRKEEAEARKRHDEKVVAQKRAEQKQEAQDELAWEQQYAQQHPTPSGGASAPSGGGGIGGVVGGVVNSVTGALGSIGGAVSGLLGMF